MKIITGLNFKMENSSISLGKFDGIHLGHRLLLSKIMEKKQYVPTVFTFQMNEEMSKIYTQQEKNQLLREIGIQREVIFPFNADTKNMSPENFISEILVKRMDAKFICVGRDFRFGRNREGDVHTLEQYQEKYQYQLEIVDKLTYDQEIISSTRIRSLMEKGQITTVNRLLGTPYFVMGKVLHGNALGRTMDMPTANILPESSKILLPFGVYATTVKIDNKMYFGVTNVGKKPTVGDYLAGVETYIMDFHEDIYDKEIQVYFHEFLRPEQKFENIDLLKKQIEADKNRAYRYLTEKSVYS